MTSTIHVFAGPSLPRDVRPELEDVVFHGPVAQGDVHALVASRPLAIAIIDGYFERVPAVWHKELLWAMSEGVHLFGAASMGALRAAELADFGMIGVGQVFTQFVTGRLQDDDEVTIVHADETSDYRPGSEAMVNIRATLRSAAEQGVISESTRAKLVAHAKSQFYPDRSYPALLEWAQDHIPDQQWTTLRAWLRDAEHRIDVKREDAFELLRILTEFPSTSPGFKRVDWSFQHTDAWEQVRRAVSLRSSTDRAGARHTWPALLDRLQQERANYEGLSRDASLRALRIALAKRDGYVPTPQDVAYATADFRRQHGLSTSEALQEWLRIQDLTEAELERLMRDEACVRRSCTMSRSDAQLELVDLLKIQGKYGALRPGADDSE